LLTHFKGEAASQWEDVQATEAYVTWSEAQGLVVDQQKVVTQHEDILRSRALAVFESTGEARPAPGVLVKMMTKVEYHEAPALAYCAAHLPGAVSFDRKMLDKVLLALHGAGQLPGFVTAHKMVQATIAADLGKALAAGDAADDG
jgi:hypothetical protein